MASSLNKVPLFQHIRYMFFTTVPSITITLIIFLILGLTHSSSDAATISTYTDTLAARFRITPWLFIIPVLTGVMIARKMPAIMVLALSILLAVVAALVFQPSIIHEIGSKAAEGARWKVMFTGVVQTIYDSVSLDTGNPEVNQLVSTRGMAGMLNTVYLIICAMCFGAAMKASGMLRNLARPHQPRSLDSHNRNRPKRDRVRPVSVHHIDFQHIQGRLREGWIRREVTEPSRGRLCDSNLAIVSLEQLRDDTSHYFERADPNLSPILFL